eukprot:c12477_g1_i2.p1 GENE.c12477_g1_i2~~c12477_g1_i2.p1  ORF type:complete len:164 (-),score=34.13 c12477_g1_i2:31-522(-)
MSWGIEEEMVKKFIVWRLNCRGRLHMTCIASHHIDPNICVAGSSEGDVVLWDVRHARCLLQTQPHDSSAAVTSVCFGPARYLVFSTSMNGTSANFLGVSSNNDDTTYSNSKPHILFRSPLPLYSVISHPERDVLVLCGADHSAFVARNFSTSLVEHHKLNFSL